MRTIDMHTHLPGKAFGTGPMATVDFLAMLDRAGIDQAVVMTVDGFFFDYITANNALAKQAAEAPDRLIPFCTVDPYSDGAVAEVRRCIRELGFKGIKLHPPLQGFSPLDSYMQLIAAEAVRLQVPILFHDGTPPYSTPLQIAYLADQFADLKIILGHGGRWDLWMEAVAAVKRYPNCYICLCGVEPPAIFARMIRDLEAKKVMIGTDAGWTHDTYLAEFRMDQFRALRSELSEKECEMIFWSTAAELLGLV
jgi:uncharacterized protein